MLIEYEVVAGEQIDDDILSGSGQVEEGKRRTIGLQ
jgi:hypothetical protein